MSMKHERMKYERVQHLIQYVKALQSGADGKALYDEYRQDLESVQPQEAFAIFNELLQEGIDETEILTFLDKVINVFYQALSRYTWTRPASDAFLKELLEENRILEEKLNAIRPLLKGSEPVDRKELAWSLEDVSKYQVHFVKKENILFPYLERAGQHFAGVSIMWALHDKAKNILRKAMQTANQESSDERSVKSAVAEVFFVLLYLVKKEELILYPSATEVLASEDWAAMDEQRWEFDMAFGQRPSRSQHGSAGTISAKSAHGEFVNTATGSLRAGDVLRILQVLPVDITLVDADNKVQFYSAGRDRVFPRSPAIIGRDVRQCHPPDSVHIVEKIVAAFRSGERSQADFWITLGDRFIHIQYFALRSEEGQYAGTLEVTQDATDVRSLTGEQRLLQWDSTE